MSFFSDKNKCFIGAVLIKTSQAIVLTWGQVNVYYYSYYKERDPSLSYKWTSLFLMIIAIPLAILVTLSMRISDNFGYKQTILFGQIILTIGALVSPFMPNFFLFLFFYLFLESVSFSICSIPTLACVWSYFPKTQGRVTGILLAVFGIATFLFVLTLTFMVNPNNAKATLSVQEGEQTYYYFDWQVAKNVPRTLLIIGSFSSTCGLIGAMLISMKKNQTPQTVQIELQDITSNRKLENSQQKDEKGIPNQEEESQGLMTINQQVCRPDIKQELVKKDFIILFYAHSAVMVMVMLLGINFKKYGLTKVNDDYYLTLVSTFSQLISSLTNLIWGYLLDYVSFKWMSIFFCFFTGILTLFLPYCATQGKIGFGLCYLILTIFDRGFLLQIGPGLNRIFGQTVGPQLYPIINSGSILGIVIAPALQWIFQNITNFDGIIYIVGLIVQTGTLSLFFLKQDKLPLRKQSSTSSIDSSRDEKNQEV